MIGTPAVAITRPFGFECEVSSGGDSLLAWCKDSGLTEQNRLHSYHCECDGRGVWPIHAELDSTVDAEFVSRKLVPYTEETDHIIRTLWEGIFRYRNTFSVGDYAAGCHISVNVSDLSPNQRLFLMRSVFRYQNELFCLGQMEHKMMRSYNRVIHLSEMLNSYEEEIRTKRERSFWSATSDEVSEWFYWGNFTHGVFVNFEDSRMEFRFPNGTRTEWRIRMMAGVLVALVEAAHNDKFGIPENEELLPEFLGSWISADVKDLMYRQYHYAEKNDSRIKVEGLNA